MVENAVENLKRCKSPGVDGIPSQLRRTATAVERIY
jgi:hypothetical protein